MGAPDQGGRDVSSDAPVWLARLFPRRPDLTALASRILEVLDRDGFLAVLGWTRVLEGFPRSACRSAMAGLLRAGLVEKRNAELRGRRPVYVYARSDQFEHEVEERSVELAEYQRRFPWWRRGGTLKIPLDPAGTRKAGKWGRVRAPTRTLPSAKGKGASPNSHNFFEPDTPATRPERDEIFALLAERLGVPVERAKAVAEEWGSKGKMPGEVAAKAYLEGEWLPG